MIAIVTGASAGLGAQFARQIVEQFPEIDTLWLIARRVGKLEDLAQTIEGKQVICLGLDLCDAKSFKYFADYLAEKRPKVGLLVNNAGCGTLGNLGEVPNETQARMCDLNVRALTLMTNTVLPYMVSGGHIINVSSIASFCPNPRMTVYSASKAYVSAFTGGLPGADADGISRRRRNHRQVQDVPDAALLRPGTGRRRGTPRGEARTDVLYAEGLLQILSLRRENFADEVDDQSSEDLTVLPVS